MKKELCVKLVIYKDYTEMLHGQQKELCVKLVIYKDYTEMLHGQQNIKYIVCKH